MNPPPASRKNEIIFGVDDERLNLGILEAFVTYAGYSFLGLSSGQECLDTIQRVQPRIILLDIQMPEMNGFETCRRLRNLPAGKQVPITFVSALSSPEYVQQGMAAGGNDFIQKPVDREKLTRRLEYWMSTMPKGAVFS